MEPTRKPWSDARRHSFVVSTLRAGTRRYPPKWECLAAAKTTKKKNKKTGRLAQHYKCNACKKEFIATDVQVDHIKPVVSKEGFSTWDMYIENLFCSIDNLQVLCSNCHSKKTLKEKGERHRNK